MLDDLLVASDPVDETGAKPSIPFDYLAVADELHSGRIKVSSDTVDSQYRESAADLAAEFAAFLDRKAPDPFGTSVPAEEKLPPIDPESIAAELGLGPSDIPADFGRIRRSFAFSNHPDRVAPHLRQRAMVRMQIANMLIDDAKRRALAAARR